MQSRLILRAHLALIFPCVLAVAGCGGGDKDSMQKRLTGVTEQMTRLENVNDRLAERLQALEIQAMNARTAATASAPAEDTRVLRPQLRVVKVGPPGSVEAAPGEVPEEQPSSGPPTPEPDAKDRPVLRDHGRSPVPAWAKPRANAGPMGQNRSGAPVRKNPQGT